MTRYPFSDSSFDEISGVWSSECEYSSSLILFLMVLLVGIDDLLSNFLEAGVGTSLMYPIGNNRL